MNIRVLPDAPFRGQVGDVEIVDTSPLHVRQVACNESEVVRFIESVVGEPGDSPFLGIGSRAIAGSAIASEGEQKHT